MEPIQIRLSQKQKTFAEYFLAFLKSLLNFKYLEKNDPHSIAHVFPQRPSPKKMVR